MAVRLENRTVAAGLLVLMAVGCSATQSTTAPTASQRLAALDARFDEAEKRLIELDAEIAASEALAEQARERARTQACLAGNAELRAKATQIQSACLEEVAMYNACEAKRSKKQAGSTALGCLIGIGIATTTGGLGTPVALGGCGMGAIAGSGRTCSPVRCEADQQKIEREVLSAKRLSEFPLCGGYLGISVKDFEVEKRVGVRISEVGPGTTAASIGLTRGDHVIAIDSRTVRSPADVVKAIERKRAGSKVRIVVVRRGHRLRFDDAEVEQVTSNGSPSPRPTFGAKLAPKQVTTRYFDGLKVLRVDGPAKLAGLRPGDVIKGVNGTLVHRRLELRQILTSVLPGQTVRLALIREGSPLELDIELGPRKGRKGI